MASRSSQGELTRQEAGAGAALLRVEGGRVGDGLGEPELYLVRPEAYNGRLPVTGRLDASAEASFRALDARWRAAFQLYNLASFGNVLGRTYTPSPLGVQVQQSRGLRFPVPLFEVSMTL